MSINFTDNVLAEIYQHIFPFFTVYIGAKSSHKDST